MKKHELLYLLFEPFLPTLYGKTRKDLLREIKHYKTVPQLLDIGGRKSNYTIGLPVDVTITELPRESDIQHSLNLGLTDTMLEAITHTRSNIRNVILEDMTQSSLPSNYFDVAVAVEVIEHVPEDKLFLRQIHRVLKPGGSLYITTPNGDYIKNEPPHHNPDHVRHYTREQLSNLLLIYFDQAHVSYGVKTGRFRVAGLKSFRPLGLRTLKVMACNVISRVESRGIEEQPHRTAHLFAVARKSKGLDDS